MHNSILLEVQYLAPVQYYSKLLIYENVIIEQQENYSKRSFRNRCHIATANGLLCLSIPLVKGKHQQTNIREVRIDNSKNWQQIHWRSIRTAYGNAPFFDYYEEALSSFYEKKYDLLFDFCIDLQNKILKLLNISPKIAFTSSFETIVDASVLDFRNQILPNNTPEDLLQDTMFKASYYAQVFEERNGFLANLSILDLLFCTGPEAIRYLAKP